MGKKELQDVICKATDAALDGNNSVASLDRLVLLYDRAKCFERAKLGFLPISVTKIQPVAVSSIYLGVSNYEQLCQAVGVFDSEMRAFQAVEPRNTDPETVLEEQERNDITLLVRPDSRVQNRESKIDILADKLSNLTLIVKKGRSSSSNGSGMK